MSETVCDDLRTEAVEALRLLGLARDDYDREEYLLSLLKVVFQRGEIAAGDRDISKNNTTISLVTRLKSENTALKALVEELVKAAEPIQAAVEYIDQMGPSMREQYFGSMTCTNKVTEHDLRSLSTSVERARAMNKETK